MEIKTYEREKLYKEVWAEPMTTVCKRYGISDVGLRKHCKKLEIPLPPNGYWSKVKAGHKTKIPSLPKSKGPEKIIVTGSSNKNSTSINESKKLTTLLFLPNDQRQTVKEYCSNVIVPDKLSRPHDLIKDSIQYFRSRKETTKPPVSRVFHISVSDEQKERAYRILDILFRSLEHLGYSINIKAPKSEHYYNYKPHVYDNVIYIGLGKDSVPILLKEIQQRVPHQPTKEELADKKRYSHIYIPPFDLIKTGKLKFEIDVYHAKRKNWRDTDHRLIEDQIGDIIIWVMEAVEVVKTIREEREAKEIRRINEERERYRIAELKSREREQLELLEQYVSNWDKAEKIRRFIDHVELKVAKIKNEEKKEKIRNWLKWARDKADWIDPLTDKTDVLFGQSEYLFNLVDDYEEHENEC